MASEIRFSKFLKNRYYLGTKIKSLLRGAYYSVPCKQKEAAQKRKAAPDERRKEMTEMAIRSRMAVLVVAALLSVAGALGTEAFLAADDAKAGTIINQPNSGGLCVKTATYPYYKCYL